jgi:ABC-type bacteriocin/lantibiotic exporter with double-glycine peptidase domain
MNRFDETLKSLFGNQMMNYKAGVLNAFLPSFLTLVSLSLILGFSSYAKTITLDFIGVTLRLFQSLGNLTGSTNQIINSHVHIEKFYQLDSNKVELKKENFQIHNNDTVEFENLNFRYFNSDVDIFENLSFVIKKNNHVLVTGPNGSGKSTLLGLIAGVLFSNSGKVKSFSNKFGYIGATPLIFESTLYENLTYGNDKNVSEEEILTFLKMLDTFKEQENYNLSRVINNKSLSSGQMQKIAFIRALLSDIEILLLDEATANLDDASKDKIFDLLHERKITIINSTHDPESFGNVNGNLKINIVDEKRIITLT